MPAELPTIASCPHCGTILIRTPRVLVHPMSGEREQIRRTLGGFWPEHAHTRFDGRIHHCPGRRRAQAADALVPASSPGRSRITSLLAMGIALGLLGSTQANAQEGAGRWLLGGAETSSYRESVRGSRTRSPLGSLLSLPQVATESGNAEPLFPPPTRSMEPESLKRHPGTEVAAGSHMASDAPGPEDPAQSWQGLELASGRYQVVDTIREDVAGVVYLAHDRNLDSHVDVEVPALAADEKPVAAVQFVRAVRSLARLGHPHLAKVTEVGTYREAPFVVAEHLAGGNLKFRTPIGPDGQPLPVAPGSLAEWLAEVASALDYLHSQGRVYLEVSPANILFDAQGRAYLGALAMSEAVAEGPLQLSQCRGPAVPLAPEVVDGAKPDGRADQYALAATVYELLSGTAFGPSTSEAPGLTEKNPAVSRSLATAVLRGLRRDPEERYPDCSAFARAVMAAARAPAEVRNLATVDRPNAAPRGSNASTPGMADRRTVTTARMVALGLVGSIIAAGVGVKVRRRPAQTRNGSKPQAPRQVVGKRLRWLHALSSQPRPTGQGPSPTACGAQCPREDSNRPVPAIGGNLLRRHELDARPRTHLAQNLLPVPYLRAGHSVPERVRRAAGAELDRVASRKAS